MKHFELKAIQNDKTFSECQKLLSTTQKFVFQKRQCKQEFLTGTKSIDISHT